MSEPSHREKYSKPPLGVMSRDIWLETRARELSRAINDYMQTYAYSAESPVTRWQGELDWVLQALRDEI